MLRPPIADAYQVTKDSSPHLLASLPCVGKVPDFAGALDGGGESSLVPCAGARLPAGKDFPLRADETAQGFSVLDVRVGQTLGAEETRAEVDGH